MKLSANQKQFVKDAEDQGFEVEYTYSGRCMYGAICPSIITDMSEFGTKAKTEWDNMGLKFVVYARI